MKKGTNKILFILLTLIILINFTACFGDLYTITYYLDDVMVSYEPSSYFAGSETVLPEVSFIEGSNKVFSGWYETIEMTGDKVISITKDDSGDKVYYGKTYVIGEEPGTNPNPDDNNPNPDDNNPNPDDNNPNPDDNNPNPDDNNPNPDDNNPNPDKTEIDLIEVFSYTSFSLDLSYSIEGEIYFEEYKVDNNKYYFYDGYSYAYYGLNNGKEYYYFEDYDEQLYYVTENDSDFDYYTDYLFRPILTNIDTTKIIFNGNYYTCDSSYLNEIGYILTGYNEEYSSFELYLSNGLISKIVLESSEIYEGQLYEYTYELTYSNFGTTIVAFPSNATHYEGDIEINDSYSISDVYQLTDGDSVTVCGEITGIYGNNFFISDGNKGILIYMGNDSDYANIVEVGSAVSVTGSVSIYNNVHQIADVTSISLVEDVFDVQNILLSDVKQTTLKNYANDLVSVNNLVIKSLPTINTSKDYTFVCELNGVEVNVFISRHIESADKNRIYASLNNASVGDIINLINASVSSYTNYQLVLTSSSIISQQPLEVISNGLVVEPSSLVVPTTYTLSNILDELKVYEKFSDGSKVEISSRDYSLNDDGYSTGQIGNFCFVFTYGDLEANCNVIVKSEDSSSFVYNLTSSPILSVKDSMCYDPETKTTYGVTVGLPSIGNPKVLVIPIEFTDCLATSTMVSDLEKAFFGSASDTGWESLSSYYAKSSYGKLNISGTVLEPFNTGHNVSYYDNLYEKYLDKLDDYYNYVTDTYPDNVEYEIIKRALEYYDDQIDYSEYDLNNDGYIDSIYLVYTCDYNSDEDSLWWAYTTEYYSENVEMYDGVEADFYMMMSYQFFFDDFYGHNITYNCETVIHETGHLLGLDDYYDYDSSVGPDGGIGGGDMMDYNVGDHNAYSKMMMGWIDPIITNGVTETFTLSNFSSSGDAIFIFKDWNGSFFSEYYVIDFYTPDGLNEMQAGNNGLFSRSGIRIYHVDASLNKSEDCYSVYELTKYNNSYTDHRLITLVEADNKNDIAKGGWSQDSDLFKTSDVYSNASWYNNSSANFTIKVNSISEEEAVITITFK